jgi:hypoxanthine phosphoribosyltransferase
MNKLILTDRLFKGLVSDLCRQVIHSNWFPDYVVGITRGGLTPAVMISHYLDVPMHSLKISLRDHQTDSESNLWMSEHAFEGKNILVIDDINDTGETLNWLMQDWQSSAYPTDPTWDKIWNGNVRFAVVVDNLASKCRVGMDYVGMEVNKAENDVWVEFPYEAWWK